MDRPILLLHNGNSIVKNYISELFDFLPMPTIANFLDLDSKINFLQKNQKIVTDLTCCDIISNKELFELKKYCKIIKVFTDYEHDLENLEPVYHNEFTKTQWLRALHYKLWASDEIFYFKGFNFINTSQDSDIIFTPGRCGTNLLSSIVNVPNWLHHNDDLINRSDFQKLSNSSKIFTIYRKNLYSLVASNSVIDRLGFVMITNKDNYQKNLQLCETIRPYCIEKDYIEEILTNFLDFVDLLLLLKVLYRRNISLSRFDFLKSFFNHSRSLKNPYDLDKLIVNQKEIITLIEKEYQEIYDFAINQMVKYCGLAIY